MKFKLIMSFKKLFVLKIFNDPQNYTQYSKGYSQKETTVDFYNKTTTLPSNCLKHPKPTITLIIIFFVVLQNCTPFRPNNFSMSDQAWLKEGAKIREKKNERRNSIHTLLHSSQKTSLGKPTPTKKPHTRTQNMCVCACSMV